MSEHGDLPRPAEGDSSTPVVDGNDEIALLREAHKALRSQIAHLTGRVQKLENSVGSAGDYIAFGRDKSLREQVKALQAQAWRDDEAKKAIEQLRKLADAFAEIFADSTTSDY